MEFTVIYEAVKILCSFSYPYLVAFKHRLENNFNFQEPADSPAYSLSKTLISFNFYKRYLYIDYSVTSHQHEVYFRPCVRCARA